MDKKILNEVMSHYNDWTDDMNIRLTRKNGWNDITDAYYGELPDDWPFDSKTTDPRIRTVLIEKNSKIAGGKYRGRLVPRESGDIISARINNAVLEFQWDNAQEGGSMPVKISLSDMDTRLYGSKFALVKWKTEYDDDGKVTFDGNECTPLDIRDCGIDYSASHIKDAKWFQHRSWEFLEDLENQTDVSGKPLFANLGKIKSDIASKKTEDGEKSTERRNEYVSRVKQLRGLEDRVGTDPAFPVVEIVTEYRKDRWITFAPEYSEVIRDIKNPYNHGKIPVAQLKYYPIQDDPIGESEVESVIPLWKAIQATVCSYLDEVVLKMRPPLKIIEGQARLETIVYGPEAQWLVASQGAIEEMRSNGEATRYFQTTYTALVSAFNTAMGMMSQGTSGVDPTATDKTATEVKQSVVQQNVRDEKNKLDLAEFIKDIMGMWLSNSKQFLFADPDKKEHILRIIGKENFDYFLQAGMDRMILPEESAQLIADIIQQNPNTTPQEVEEMSEAAKIPEFPVVENPEEKDPSKLKIKPKMKINEMGDMAEVYVTPDDLNGVYDYIPDIKSMTTGAETELMAGRQNAINLLTTNPTVLQLLAQEGFKPKVKELLTSNFEDLGLKDAERYFEKLQPQIPGQLGQPPVNPLAAGAPQMGGIQPPQQAGGLPAVPQAPAPIGF